MPAGWVLLIADGRVERYCSRWCVALSGTWDRVTAPAPLGQPPYSSPDDLPEEPVSIHEEPGWEDDLEPVDEPPLPSDDDPQFEEDDEDNEVRVEGARPAPARYFQISRLDFGTTVVGIIQYDDPDTDDDPPSEPHDGSNDEPEDQPDYEPYDQDPFDQFDEYEDEDPYEQVRQEQLDQWLSYLGKDSPYRSLWDDNDEEPYKSELSIIDDLSCD